MGAGRLIHERGVGLKRALVFGGTRFFGKRLVHNLVEGGWAVTVASRGLSEDPFGETVERLTLDRHNRESLEVALGQGEWDVVYDQICFAPSDALDTCQLLAGRIGRYVLTSTGSVYKDKPMPYKEEYFDPYNYPVKMGRREDYDYGEGKRLSEAVLLQQAGFPVVAMRIPVVVGTDDYTQRLAGVVRMIRDGRQMRTPDLNRVMGFISADEAAQFLYWLAEAPVSGPYNAAATGNLTMGELFQLIEGIVGKQAQLSDHASEQTPLPGSSFLDNSRAREAGFSFSVLREWLPQLIEELRDL
jgi:nucleoside-diphosphate-sugar epimerase